MAKDDMEIIMYKILKYLYECLKSGRKTSIADVAWECRRSILQEHTGL